MLDLAENYFQTAIHMSKGSLLVDTEKCKVPEMNEWSSEVRKLIKYVAPFECRKRPNVTYVNYQSVIINENALQEMGYGIEDVSCCYRTILRVEQSLASYDSNADYIRRYSDSCYAMTRITKPISGYIKVNCNASTNLLGNVVIYENFHLIPQLINVSEKLTKKLTYWQEYQTMDVCNETICTKTAFQSTIPPNILLIGLDSTSRLNFRRHMNKTRLLLNNIGAVELKGHTKVGVNTYPNMVALLSSYSYKELETICLPKSPTQSAMDNCPFLWKKFSEQNYVTAHLEDAPGISIFNYLKIGFVKAPADLYARPWMLSAYKENNNKKIPFTTKCLGYQRPEEHILAYVRDLAVLADYHKTPYFTTTWLTDLTHDSLNALQTLDETLSDTLATLNNKKLLDNTILFVASDHGYMYGDIRKTASGWLELKLPALYIKIGDNVATQYPNWLDAVKYNSNKLSTPFNMHGALEDILDVSSSTPNPNISRNIRGLSLFERLPARSCDEAGIPEEFCVCMPSTTGSLNLTLVEIGARDLVRSINNMLPEVCSPLRVSTVTAAVILKQTRNETFVGKDYSISFVAQPGSFSFEGVITYNEITKKFDDIPTIQRSNKKNRDTTCLQGKDAIFELFCYCKQLPAKNTTAIHV